MSYKTYSPKPVKDKINESRLASVLNQKNIPILYRCDIKGSPLYVKLPYTSDNMFWLRNGAKREPKWNRHFEWWETPKSWFNDLVSRSLHQYDRIYVIQPYKEQEKCSPACRNASGHKCSCSCMGAHHGSKNAENNWFVVSETFASRWSDLKIACRLICKT